MNFRDEGLILNIKNYSENSAIIKILSKSHGIYRGFIKNSKSKKFNSIIQISNLVSFEFKNRIEENLGSFTNIDLIESKISKFIFEKIKLDCIQSLLSIINDLFLERENLSQLFEKLNDFINKISNQKISQNEIIANYIKLEIFILSNLGYGLDLESCVVTNSKIDLAFVSPKSARAVSFNVGKNYANKLLKLPQFLISEHIEPDYLSLLDGLKLTEFFIEKFLIPEKNFYNSKQYLFYRNNIRDKITVSPISNQLEID